jgi:hypothetical protein
MNGFEIDVVDPNVDVDMDVSMKIDLYVVVQ